MIAQLCGLGSGCCLMLRRTLEQQLHGRLAAEERISLSTVLFAFHRCRLVRKKHNVVNIFLSTTVRKERGICLSVLLDQCLKSVLQQQHCALWKITSVPAKRETFRW